MMENIDKLVQLITDRLLEKMPDMPSKEQVYFVGKDTTKQFLADEGFGFTADVAGADLVLVDQLILDSLLRLSNLCPTTEIEHQLLTALLTGKRVLVSAENLGLEAYKKTAHSLLYRNLLKQKEILEKYGVHFYREDQLLSLLQPEKVNKAVVTPSWQQERRESQANYPKRQESGNGETGKRLLITETKLKAMNLSEGDTFKVEKGMIMTALAKDYLARHHITIID